MSLFCLLVRLKNLKELLGCTENSSHADVVLKNTGSKEVEDIWVVQGVAAVSNVMELAD